MQQQPSQHLRPVARTFSKLLIACAVQHVLDGRPIEICESKSKSTSCPHSEEPYLSICVVGSGLALHDSRTRPSWVETARISIGVRSIGGPDAQYEAAVPSATQSGSGWVSANVLFDADPPLGRAERQTLDFIRVAVERVHVRMRCRMLVVSASFHFPSAWVAHVMC